MVSPSMPRWVFYFTLKCLCVLQVAGPLSMDVNSARIQCVCHIVSVPQCCKVWPLTDETWQTLCEYVNAWRELDGIEQSVAVRFDAATAITQGYHQKCFRRFTNKQRLEARRTRRSHQNTDGTDSISTSCNNVCTTSKAAKVTSEHRLYIYKLH